MKAIVVTEQAAGTAGMTPAERPEPQPAINDVVVQVQASGFVPTELEWPSTWTDRLDRDRTPSIPGHEKACPVAIWEYGLAIDSAGAGEHRGGFAASYTFEALSTTYMTTILDGSRFSPRGLDGGSGGATTFGALVERAADGSVRSWNGVLPAARLTPFFGTFDEQGRPDPIDGEWGRGTRFRTTKPTSVELAPGEIFHVQVVCPGGWGDPLARDPDAVASDVANERISLAQARDVYGVVLDADSLVADAEATAEARRRLADERDGAPPISCFRSWPVGEAEFEQLVAAPPVGARRGAEV